MRRSTIVLDGHDPAERAEDDRAALGGIEEDRRAGP